MKFPKKDSRGVPTIITVVYFLGSVFYMLGRPEDHSVQQVTFESWKRAMYYILAYGVSFYFVLLSSKSVYYSTDIFSVGFLKVYFIFKLIFFNFLLTNDLPTYIRLLDSKILSLFLSIFVLVFMLFLFIIDYDRYKKFLG